MRAVLTLLMLALVTLAGCADEAPSEATDPDEVDFDDEVVVVTETTGAVLGVVINDAILPVEGASVTVLGSEAVTGGDPLSDTTDAQGRFTFSGLPAGTYFLDITKDLHDPVQTSVDVAAGVENPPILKVQLNRLYSGEPFVVTLATTGFFTCSQAAMPPYFYSSSSCHDTYWVDGSDYGIELDQERTFHADVGAGWQSLLFEMEWTASAQGTSDRMGMVVSTEKETREGGHWFADFVQGSPMYGRIDCCEPHPTAADVEPRVVPENGMTDMSYFMSVREPEDAVCLLWCLPPGLALDQKFDVWHTQAYYQPLPEGWSFRNGDATPF